MAYSYTVLMLTFTLQKALIPRLFKLLFVQGFLGFYEQSNTLHVMRLRKQIHRLDFDKFVP